MRRRLRVEHCGSRTSEETSDSEVHIGNEILKSDKAYLYCLPFMYAPATKDAATNTEFGSPSMMQEVEVDAVLSC